MKISAIAAAALLILTTASCGGGGGGAGVSVWPTGQDIDNTLGNELSSVAGGWQGTATVPNGLRLDFTLLQASNGQVSGSGMMKETDTAAAVPITVTGTFQRPLLTLTFNGMVVEFQQVTGTAQGNYTTVGGIATTLNLTAPGYSRAVAILLQEK